MIDGQDYDRIELVDIEHEMREAYLDYAMSVITARALPDVRDGLKPVQRRILYTMYDSGLRPDRPFKKSAATVGNVLGMYHPHGDSAVYDAMVRLAQPFSLRYLLVDGQGNFGSIDGDPAAAYRYTEARPTAMAMELLAEIDMDTVDFRPNFDDSRQEPVVLPSRAPNLVLNGASGIAVGMATNIPPHNLGEVCDALTFVLDNFERREQITPDELMAFIPGPDFPTGGMILGTDGIKLAYATGRGRVIMRATTHFEDMDNGRTAIIVTEIPYQLNKTTLLERIAELARTKKVDGLADLRDESDRKGMRIVIELKRAAAGSGVLHQLFKYSQLQATFGVNTLALVDGEPRVLPLKRMLLAYLDHRRDVIRRRSVYELDKAKARQHVLEGYLTALANLDAVIDTIRKSKDAPDARERLMANFELSEIQAQAILDMQLRRLAGLERQKIEDEYAEVTARIAFLESLLADEVKILDVIREDLADLKATYGDPRRTIIIEGEGADITDMDMVEAADVLITVTERGYIKRVLADTYRSQRRGGRGIIGARAKGEDTLRDNFVANTRDRLLFFTDRGRVFQLPTHHVPESSREAAGTPLINLIQLNTGERVTVALPVSELQFQQGEYLVMATRLGRLKRTRLAAYDGVRPSGLIAINLEEGDQLRWVKITEGNDELVLVTRKGRALRFRERDVRPMGRAAQGVMGIRLKAGDEVAAMDRVIPGADLLVLTTKGYGKRTPLEEYATRGRFTQGILTLDVRRLNEIGEIADARVVEGGHQIAVISDYGITMRTSTDSINRMGRATRGVRIIRLDEGHQVASFAYLAVTEPVDGEEGADGEGVLEGEDGVLLIEGAGADDEVGTEPGTGAQLRFGLDDEPDDYDPDDEAPDEDELQDDDVPEDGADDYTPEEEPEDDVDSDGDASDSADDDDGGEDA